MRLKTNNKLDESIARLYRKSLSAPLIAQKLDLPLNRVYRSLRKQGVERRPASEQNYIRFQSSPLSFKFKKPRSLTEKQLAVAALMLYHGEGAKTQNTVDFANSDAKALALFLKFLRNVCQVDESKLRFYLYCFANQDSKRLISFWSKTLNISAANFTRPYIRKEYDGLKRIMPFGVLHIRYSDKRLLEKILTLTQSMIDNLS